MTQGSVGWESRIETSGLASGVSSDAEVFYSMLTSLNFSSSEGGIEISCLDKVYDLINLVSL